MYLKKVEMENFKSFGGKLEIPMMEGYTAITGPNGSGKSNITDAILFVLGPKSSKAMRAGRLTDLIFDGGKQRKPADFTKVSLVFDNEDRMLPWDSDTVKLTRHVKFAADGENYSSHFFVNDQRSTMSEFDSLLTRARISADGYNMVQQGDVTGIVQMSNVDRRRVLDRISGIASYDADIAKAQAERLEAETNLDRIGILLTELEAQIEQLRKDVDSARKYLEAQSRLEMARAQLVHRGLEAARAELEYNGEKILEHEREIADLKSKREEVRELIVELEGRIRDVEAEIEAKVGPEYADLKNRINNMLVEVATLQDRIETASEENDELEHGLALLAEEAAEAESDVLGCRASMESRAEDLAAREAEQKRVRDDISEINAEMSSKGGEHLELQKKLERIEADLDAKQAAEHEARVREATATTAEEDASRALASLEEQLSAAGFEIKDCEWSIQEAKAEAGPADVTEITDRILQAKKREAELERQEADLISAIGRISDEYNQLLAEKKVSDRVSRGSEAVLSVLEMRDKGTIGGIHGTIMELASVNPEYETALVIAAGGRMQAIVVEDDQVAADAMAVLKKTNAGRATFLPLNKMLDGKPRAKAIMAAEEAVGFAIDLIEFDPQYQAAFWYVFGDTVVVDTLTEARRLMGGVRLVTKDGELIEASGAMIGGTVGRAPGLRFGASSQSKLDSVGAELRAARDALDALRGQIRALRDNIREMDAQMRQASAGSQKVQEKLGRYEAQLSELRNKKSRISAEVDAAKLRYGAAKDTLAKARDALSRESEELEALRGARTETRARISEIAPAEMQERIRVARERDHDLMAEISEISNELSSLRAEMAGYETRLESIRSEEGKAREKISRNSERIQAASEEKDAKSVELKALRAMEAEMEAGIKDLRDRRDKVTEDRFKAESRRDAMSEKIVTKEGFKASLEAQTAIHEENIRQLEEEVAEISIEVELPLPSEEELRRTVKSCETVMARIGNVNLRAIEDFEERSERHGRLKGETDILEIQIKELTDLMESLNSEKKGLFMETYEGVHGYFKEIYAQLSDGGEAYMALEDEDDPFAGGLLINAKPKHGKMLRLDALSGGEKSLTALAFIFAIQELQPSPFYVLDEVDMFLDAVNAEMVAKRIAESAGRTQFIQVSLRKVTLARAEHLIGVTRQPSGVSKVIMQPDFAEVSKYEEEALRQQRQSGDGVET
ncbi:MAG: chromosome segregation protein SMC [Thermoplasmatales archaeon]|nr:chromosome segregation protein SMC [Thermoplasmatales archaeon]